MKFDIREIARITGGTLYPAEAKDLIIGISTDSRKTRNGENSIDAFYSQTSWISRG